jgi:hypothetical protein
MGKRPKTPRPAVDRDRRNKKQTPGLSDLNDEYPDACQPTLMFGLV